MTLDISGKAFNPRDNVLDLAIAQGKLTLDSEQNAAVSTRDRNQRVQMLDLIGRAGYPAALPDSFRITLAGGQILIGAGRMWVDGLLAENHGLSTEQGGIEIFDVTHEELRSATPVPFGDQPYLPGVTPPDPADGDHLIYLDVWRRVVSHLKDPSLVDPAVGIDTAGRVQTVWQVRALAVPDGVTCETPDDQIPQWPEEIAPSSLRLSCFLVPVSDPDNPCVLPPGSELRTTENRTYKVAVGGTDQAGQPLLKWSRANGSVGTRVRTIDSAIQLTVDEVARDDFNAFVPGNWIEIVDDRIEFAGEPGIMRMIATADPATNVITLETGIPAATFATDADGVPDPDFNLRILRWDQSGVVEDSNGTQLVDLTDPNSSGLIPLPAAGAFVELEAGIAISVDFLPDPQKFRIEDEWSFRVRAATGTIEELVQAPPCAIHHHYTRLAVLEAGPNGFVEPIEDCRDPIDLEGECCCTVVIRPGENIQVGIDSLPPTGGCVCLKPGVHILPQTILLTRSDVALKGEAKGVIVEAPGGAPALRIQGTPATPVERTRIHTITFVGNDVPANAGGLFELVSAEDLVIDDCIFSASEEEVDIAIRLSACADVAITNCEINRALSGVIATVRCSEIAVHDCQIALGTVGGGIGIIGIGMENAVGPIDIRRTDIRNGISGVIVNDAPLGTPSSLATGSRVIDCVIDCAAAPTQRDGAPVPTLGIDMAAEEAEIRGNRVTYPGELSIGIRIAGSHDQVLDNRCVFTGDGIAVANFAIVLGAPGGDDVDSIQVSDVQITGNTVEGAQSGIVGLNALDCQIAKNRVDQAGQSPTVIGIIASQSSGLTITGNHIAGALVAVALNEGARNRVDANEIEGGGFAIVTLLQDSLTIADNRLLGASQGGILIFFATARTVIAGNRVIGCGFAATAAFGIAAGGCLGEVVVRDNEVMDTGEGGDDQSAATAFGIFLELVLEALVEDNLVTYTGGAVRDVANEDRALRARGFLEFSARFGNQRIVLGFPIKILGNSFIGTGNTALVELAQQSLSDNLIIRFERVTFNDNYCMHFSPPPSDARATVELRGHRASIVGNHIKSALGQYFPVNINNVSTVYVGNTAEQSPIQGSTIPVPVNDFNLDS